MSYYEAEEELETPAEERVRLDGRILAIGRELAARLGKYGRAELDAARVKTGAQMMAVGYAERLPILAGRLGKGWNS